MAVVIRSSMLLTLTMTDDRFQCAICTYLLNAPLQFPCGHRICTLCARKLKQDKLVRMTYPLKFIQCYTLWPAVLRHFTTKSVNRRWVLLM